MHWTLLKDFYNSMFPSFGYTIIGVTLLSVNEENNNPKTGEKWE